MRLFPPHQYQPEAEELFLTVREEIRAVLGDVRVEHVGSSSICGSISKGDVDMCVIVDAFAHAGAVAALEQAGYKAKPDTLRTAELCMMETARHDVDLALQVVANGSRFEFFVTFRDALRSNPALVAAYNQVKLRHKNSPTAEYREAKAEFIEAVLREV